MGRDALKEFRDSCPHPDKCMTEIWEDHILMGSIYYGKHCTQCGKDFYDPPGLLELGVYK